MRAKAEQLAQDIAAFPPVCVRTDPHSAIRAIPYRFAMIQEWYNGREALIKTDVQAPRGSRAG